MVAESYKRAMEVPGANLWHLLPDKEHHPLPPVEGAMKYIDGRIAGTIFAQLGLHIYIVFFHTFNSTLPLYSQDLFREKYRRVPFPTPEGDTAWYTSLNVVISIGHIIRMKRLATDVASLAYIRNAASTYVDLVFKHSSLDAVQALLGMVRCWNLGVACERKLLILK